MSLYTVERKERENNIMGGGGDIRERPCPFPLHIIPDSGPILPQKHDDDDDDDTVIEE